MSSSSFATIFAQVTNAASAAAVPRHRCVGHRTHRPAQAPWWTNLLFPVLIIAMVYFALIRPQMQAKKKQEETIKTAKTGDKIVTSSGIHGVITNVKDTTVIVRVADNVKLEIEKTHIDKITRPESRFGKSRPRQGFLSHAHPHPVMYILHLPRLPRLHRLFHLVSRGGKRRHPPRGRPGRHHRQLAHLRPGALPDRQDHPPRPRSAGRHGIPA